MGRGSARLAGIVAGWARAVHRAIRARQSRGALEADRLVRAGKEVENGLLAVQVRIEDGRDRHHHAELRRSRGHVQHNTTSRLMRASAFAQHRLCHVVAHDHATARTHIQTVRVRGGEYCEARARHTYLRIGMGCRGALVGCGSCSSRRVTGTVQMRSPGSVRFMMYQV